MGLGFACAAFASWGGAQTIITNGTILNGASEVGDFLANGGSSFTAKNGTVFSAGTTDIVNGYVYLSGAGTALTIASDGTWTGNVTVQASAANVAFVNNGSFTNSAGTNRIYGAGLTGFSFTNNGTVNSTAGTLYIGYGATDSITNGAAGTIEAIGGNVYFGAGGGTVTVANQGTLEATGVGSNLTLGVSASTVWTNTGIIIATNNGVVNLGGTFSSSDLTSGTIAIIGSGTLNITGNLNNTTLSGPNGGGIFTLDGGTITGGTVNGGALTFGTSSSSTLNGVTMNGSFNVPSSGNIYAENGTVFTGGTTTFVNSYIILTGTGTALTNAAGDTLTGDVTVQAQAANVAFVNNGTFTNASSSNNLYGGGYLGFTFTNNGTVNATGGTLYMGNGGNDVLTNTPTGTVSANGGNIYYGNTSGSSVSNAGSLHAFGASTLYLGTGNSAWSNTGSITASSGGTVDLGGTFPTANLTSGTINGAGGTLNLTGTVNNLSSTLVAPTSGIYTLAGGTITNGTVNGNALTFGSTGTLNGVTMSGNFNFLPSAYATVYVQNSTTFTGGTTTFPTVGYDSFGLNSVGATLTLSPSAVWTGNISVYGQNTGTVFANQGTLNLNAGSNSIYGNNSGFTFDNTGTVNATSGNTYLGNYLNDVVVNGPSGSIISNGSGTDVYFGYSQASWVNQGSILATNNGVVNFQGSYTTADLGGTIDSNTGGILYLQGTLNNAAATLNPPHTGLYTIAGATITGGTVASGAVTFSNYGGTLNGVTMSGSFAMPVNNYASFDVTGNTTFTGGGTTTFTTPGYDVVDLVGSGTALTIAPGATWAGSVSIYGQASNIGFVNQGTMNFGNGSNYFYGNSNGLTFTNTGALNEASAGTVVLGYYSNDTVTNGVGGSMTSSGTGSVIYLGDNQAAWSNQGSLLATNNGVIVFGGNYTTADFGGTIDANTGGILYLEGALNNAAATLNPPNSGAYTLAGATVTGGTIAGGALTFSNSGGTLDGVTMNGSFVLPASAYAYFYAQNNTTFTGGTTTFTTAGYDVVDLVGSGTALTIAPGATWAGSVSIYGQASNIGFVNQGTMNFGNGSNYFYGNSNGLTFTNTGALNEASAGTVVLGYYSNDTVTNGVGGSMTSSGTGSVIYLGDNQAAWSNQGSLLATNNGVIVFGGNYTTADFGGTIDANTGGILYLEGALNNAAATLNPPNSGAYTLAGATVTGGTIAGGALTFSNSGGTLDGVTMNGSFVLPASAYAYFYAQNNTTFTGGTTTFTTAGYDTVEVSGTGTGLTIAPSATWTGGVNVYGQSPNVTFANQGTINLTSGSSSIYGSGGGLTFLNTGSFNVGTGAYVTLGYYSNDVVTNGVGATMTANGTGAKIYLGYNVATWSNQGTLLATNNGAIDFSGNFTTANLGGVISATSGGALNFVGSLNNTASTLNPPSTGTYTLSGGTITGGTVASGALTFGNSGGTLNGVTMNGNFTLPASTYADFYASNNTTFTGGTTAFSPSNGYDTIYLGSAGTALTVAPSETWTGSFGLYGEVANASFVNQGTIDMVSGSEGIYGIGLGFSFLNGGLLEKAGGTLYLGDYANDSFTNQVGGTLEANGCTIYVGYGSSTVTNLTGGTLSGGTWIAAGTNGLLSFEGTTPINTIALGTVVDLDGTTSVIRTKSGAGPSYQTVQQTLTANFGTLEVLNGASFASTSAGGIANSGTIELGGGVFSATSLVNNPGSMISGSGTFSPTGGVVIGSGVVVAPGNPGTGTYVNTLSFGTGLTLGTGGAGIFDIENASGGAGVGYDTINVTGTALITANSGSPFTLYVESINPGTGNLGVATFNMAQSYQWTLLSAGSISGFSASDFTVDSSLFANSLGGGAFTVTSNANDIFLNFTPVPEPSTWALLASGAAAVGLACLRRRRVRVSGVR